MLTPIKYPLSHESLISIKHKKNLRDFRHAGSNSLVGAEPLALVDFVLVDFCYPEITL